MANIFYVPELTNSDFGEGRIAWTLFRSLATWIRDNKTVDTLDLSGVKHLKPYAVALFVAVAKRLGSEGLDILQPVDVDARDHLTRLNVPNLLGTEWPPAERRQTNIPLEILTAKPSEGFAYNVAELLERDFPSGLAPGIKARIADGIDEVILNALAHSSSPIGCVVVGQAFPQKHCIEASVLDLGITIRGHLSQRYPELRSDEAAIAKAVEEGVTGTPDGALNLLGDPNSGVGLTELKQYVEATQGELAILSGSALVCFGAKTCVQSLTGPRFPGTLVNVRFNTSPGVS